MNKLIGIITLSLLTLTFSFAQEGEGQGSTGGGSDANPQIQNKNGKDLMPVAGEFAVGFSASSIIDNVLGNFGDNGALGDNNRSTLYVSSTSIGQGIYGKYMLSDDAAVRVNFSFYAENDVFRERVQNDAFLHPDSVLYDQRQFRTNNYELAVGYELRRGKGRFRVLYGGNVGFGISGSRNDYEYANALSASNTRPSISVGNYRNNSTDQRLVYDDNGRSLNLRLRGFIGAEYFFAPKAAIGAELGWSGLNTWTRDQVDIYEVFDLTTNEVIEIQDLQDRNYGDRQFTLNIDDMNSWLYLMIYF